VASGFTIVTDIFLRLIKMIIAPLVFSTLVIGIAHMGDTATLGRIGARTMAWFIGATIVSLSLGLVLVNLLGPGRGISLPMPPADATLGLDTKAFSLHTFLTHLVPTSIFDAMAKNEILPIVIFSLFVGVALTAIGEKAAPIVRGRGVAGRADAADHRLCDARRAARGVRRDRQCGRGQRPRDPVHLRQVHRQLLSGAGGALGGAVPGRLAVWARAPGS
jgi:hypothetical protein